MQLILPFLSKILKIKKYEHCGEWARENRILPPENSEPGPFRIERTPYFIPIALALSNPKYKQVGVECASQMAKTELVFNFVGHRMDFRAQPSMLVFPIEKLAKNVSKTRFQKVLDTSPTLSRKYNAGKHDNIMLKDIGGSYLIFSYATSANQLCSYAIATYAIDEFDRCPIDVEGEGSPLELVVSRTTTFPNAKGLITSTPLLLDSSPIHKLWKSGTALRWHIKCPHCGEWILPSYSSFHYDSQIASCVERAWIECDCCRGEIDDRYRKYFNTPGNGKYFYIEESTGKRYTIEERVGFDIATFWISGLVSPWRSFVECARRWLEAVESKSETRKQAVMNTVFGEPYELIGECPTLKAVMDCRRDYNHGQLRVSCSDFIFMTVDVQKRGIYYVIRGWNTKLESSLIERGYIMGDTSKKEIWQKLRKLSKKRWGRYEINYIFIDANWRSAFVYAFCKRYGKRYVPCQGREKMTTPVQCLKVEVTKSGKRIPYGIVKFAYEEGHFKDLLYSYIRDNEKWFLPQNIDEEYCKQVTSEILVEDGGKAKWIKKYSENHFLDCEKMQILMSILYRIELSEEQEEISKLEVFSGEYAPHKNSQDKADSLICELIDDTKTNAIVEEKVIEGTLESIKDSDREQLLELQEVQTKEKKSRINSKKSKLSSKNVLQVLSNSDNIGLDVWG